jgi:cyclopropane fatty-acyl-phospholipid synthase-like methyltransferase
MDPKELVEQGYDRMAESYLTALTAMQENNPITLAALEEMARTLPPGAAVLDLGCGPGVPVTRWLAQGGYAVTGVDISARQLELARQHVPGATFIKSDMTSLDFPPETFDAVVSFYAIVHVPRTEQPALVGRIHNWLKPGGAFLATWATSSWEGSESDWEGWGAPMWWSHYGRDENLDMLRAAGFAVASAEVRTHTFAGSEESWLWVLARKPERET